MKDTVRLFAWQDGYAGISVSPSQLESVKNTSRDRRSIIANARSTMNFWHC